MYPCPPRRKWINLYLSVESIFTNARLVEEWTVENQDDCFAYDDAGTIQIIHLKNQHQWPNCNSGWITLVWLQLSFHKGGCLRGCFTCTRESSAPIVQLLQCVTASWGAVQCLTRNILLFTTQTRTEILAYFTQVRVVRPRQGLACHVFVK